MMYLRRREFPHSVKRAAIARSTGICECHRVPQLMALLNNRPCGVTLVTGHVRFEHIICVEIRPDNSLNNCAALTTTCWRIKTDKFDLPLIAKTHRQSDRHAGIKGSNNPLPGGRSDPRKRTMDGVVVDRKTGERWR